MQPGLVISFEGITGAGKSSALQSLRSDLVALGYSVVVKEDLLHFRGRDIGKDIKAVLDKHRRGDPYFRMGHPIVETLLICAKRAYESEMKLRPALLRGGIVLADRDRDTVCALQLVSLQATLSMDATAIVDWVWNVDRVGTPDPDLTFYFDCPVETAVNRACNRDGKTARQDDYDFNRSAATAFEVSLAVSGRGQVIRIDSDQQSAADAFQQVRRNVHGYLKQRLEP